MKKYLFLLTILSTTILAGCAVGPLVNHETARTVGKSNHELIGGYGQAGYAIKWNFGLTENLDLGLHWETLSIGLRLKYAFINNKQGWSLASALGTGSSIGGRHYYGDIIGSYMIESWEPYGALRIVHVKNDPVEFKDKDTGYVDFTVPSVNYNYGQFILGTRYWFTSHWLLSLEASSLFAMTTGLKFGNIFLVSGAFGYRF